MEFVDQFGQTFLGTSQGLIIGTSNLVCRFGSLSERSGILGEHPVPSGAVRDAVIFGKSQLLQ